MSTCLCSRKKQKEVEMNKGVSLKSINRRAVSVDVTRLWYVVFLDITATFFTTSHVYLIPLHAQTKSHGIQ